MKSTPLTGPMVFSTLHNNSAPESITRLLDMGMDAFYCADALLGILAQRLAKKLFDCKDSFVPSAQDLKDFIKEYAEELRHADAWKTDAGGESQNLLNEWTDRYAEGGQLKLYRAAGCDKCNKTGYKGRIGLHELMITDDAAKKLIYERARVVKLFALAINSGVRTLKMDGVEEVLIGLTDLKIVRLVCIK